MDYRIDSRIENGIENRIEKRIESRMANRIENRIENRLEQRIENTIEKNRKSDRGSIERSIARLINGWDRYSTWIEMTMLLCGRPRNSRSSRLVRDRLSLKVHELELEVRFTPCKPMFDPGEGTWFSWGLRSWIE